MNKLKQFDQLQNPILGINKNLDVVYYNFNAVTFFKTPPRILKSGIKISDLFFWNDAKLDKFFETESWGETHISQEVEIFLKKSPESAFYVILKLFSCGKDAPFILELKDMSVEIGLYQKYKKQIFELKENHVQLLQADKLATLGELSANLSHEISNPLTISLGNLEVAQDLLKPSMDKSSFDFISRCVQDAKDGLDRINEIIMNMKKYLHKGQDQREYVDLAAVAQKALDLLLSSSESLGIKVETNFEPNVVGFINASKIGQVMVNLIKNAQAALSNIDSEEKRIWINVSKNDKDNSLTLAVYDNGPGVPEADRENIFNPFFTTKDIGEGTGLGLSITRKFIDSHGGTIQYTVSPAGGGGFVVELPGVEISSYTFNDHYLAGMESRPGVKIMAVDNEPQVLNVLGHIFENERLGGKDIVFLGSTSGPDALKLLEKIEVDCIFVDYNMPRMNGGQFVQELRKTDQQTPIIFISGQSDDVLSTELLTKLKVLGLVGKPFSKEGIFKYLNSIILDDEA